VNRDATEVEDCGNYLKWDRFWKDKSHNRMVDH
jgi:hypothetical protein